MVIWLARTKVRYFKNWSSGLSARGGQVARALILKKQFNNSAM